MAYFGGGQAGLAVDLDEAAFQHIDTATLLVKGFFQRLCQGGFASPDSTREPYHALFVALFALRDGGRRRDARWCFLS